MASPPKIISILGTSRSGSTLLDNILGQIDGFLSVGELRFLWRRILQERLCGCGEPIGTCAFWTRVRADIVADLGDEFDDPHAVVSWQEQSVKFKKIISLLRTRQDRVEPGSPLEKYRDLMLATYRSLARTEGTRVVVDSSKSSPNAALLHLMPGVEYYFVHLVRDPRGVVFSEMAKKVNPDWAELAYMPRASNTFTIVSWMAANTAAELTWRMYGRERTLLLRYEDFIADAPGAVRRILDMVGESPATLPFVGPNEVRLGTNHTVAGNPSRFETGTVALRPDNRWISQLPRGRKALTTAACLPLLLRHRYALVPSSARRMLEEQAAADR